MFKQWYESHFTPNFARYTIFGCGVITLRSQFAIDTSKDHGFPVHVFAGRSFGISIFGRAV